MGIALKPQVTAALAVFSSTGRLYGRTIDDGRADPGRERTGRMTYSLNLKGGE